MNLTALLKVGVVAGVVLNVLDFIVQGNLLAGMMASMPAFRNVDDMLPYLIAGDFVAGFVFAWAFLKLGRAAGAGVAGGATFGLYAGVLIGFPTWIFMHMLINGVPYGLAWIQTVYTAVAYVIVGAAAGAVQKA